MGSIGQQSAVCVLEFRPIAIWNRQVSAAVSVAVAKKKVKRLTTMKQDVGLSEHGVR